MIQVNGKDGRGRKPSIPHWAYEDVLRLFRDGIGCRKIVKQLEEKGVFTTKSSVSRLLLGRPPYTEESIKGTVRFFIA